MFRAGTWPPSVASIVPRVFNKHESGDSIVVLDISGSSFLYGANAVLMRPDMSSITLEPDSLEWLGENRIMANFRADRLDSNEWDVMVTSGDGQQVVAGGAFGVVSCFNSVAVVPGRSSLKLSVRVNEASSVDGLVIYRSAGGEDFEKIREEPLPAHTPGLFEYRDETILPVIEYSYRLVALSGAAEVETLALPGPYSIERLPFIANRNYPNPFLSETEISFFTPSRLDVSIDIYDVAGRLVHSFGKKSYGRGTHTVRWKPGVSRISTGFYFCVFRYRDRMQVAKMALIR